MCFRNSFYFHPLLSFIMYREKSRSNKHCFYLIPTDGAVPKMPKIHFNGAVILQAGTKPSNQNLYYGQVLRHVDFKENRLKYTTSRGTLVIFMKVNSVGYNRKWTCCRI